MPASLLRTLVSNLRATFLAEGTPARLATRSDELLTACRAAWKAGDRDLGDEDLAWMAGAQRRVDAADQLVALLEDADHVVFRDDAYEVLTLLDGVIATIGDGEVGARARRARKALQQRASALPTEETARRHAEREGSLRQFARYPPRCPVCSEKMVIVRGEHDEFWGCSMFSQTRCRGTIPIRL